jgi:hypothetical protein
MDALDSGDVVLLLMLDMSSAFDTIEHSILLRRQQYSFGVDGAALAWFASYLKDMVQSVRIGDSVSDPQTMKYGVPQGSVLGPKMYCMYTRPIGNILQQFNQCRIICMLTNPKTTIVRFRDIFSAIQTIEAEAMAVS